MTLSSEDRERRKHSLGSSDIAAILGFLYPWRTAADVQAEKLWPMAEGPESGAIRVGNLVERALCEYAVEERQLAEPVVYSPPMIQHDLLPFHANLDAHAPARCVIEAKTTGHADDWGEPGTDQVPDAVIVQATWQLAVVGLDVALIPVMFAGHKRDVQLYEVGRNEDLVDELMRQGEAWWELHVRQRRPVEGTPPTLDTLQRIVRVPKKTVIVAPQLAWDLRRAKDLLKRATAAEKECQARLIAAMGDGDAAVAEDDGRTLATYHEQDRKGYEVKATKYRTLRLPKEEE